MAEPLLVATRFGLYVALGLGFGLPLYGLYGGRGPSGAAVASLAAAGLSLSVLGLAALAAAMAGVETADVAAADLGALLDMPGTGPAALVSMAALAVALAAAALLPRGRRLWAVTALLGALALASLAWTGHGAATQGRLGTLHLAADIVHLLAGGAWLGALAALGGMLARPLARWSAADVRDAYRALAGFAGAGTAIVVTIVVTGVINTFALVGGDRLTSLPASLYGRLLLAKLALFALMLAIAALNRFRLTPALGDNVSAPTTPVRALRRSLTIEAAAIALILMAVAWIGRLEPNAVT